MTFHSTEMCHMNKKVGGNLLAEDTSNFTSSKLQVLD